MKKTFITAISNIAALATNHKKIALAISLAIISLVYYIYTQGATSTTTYQYTTVKQGTLSSTISGTGQVISNSQVDLKPKVNANVTGVYVRAGDRVKSGQVLFRLDATDAYKQVRDAKTSLEAANIALLKLRNPKAVDVMSLNNQIQQEVDAKAAQDLKVTTAYKTLLSSNIQAVADNSYTNETAPTITGSYTKGVEGDIKVSLYQGGPTGYGFSLSGITSGGGQANQTVAQPLGDTGLYIKWNNTNPTTNWIISIPNKQSINYSSNYDAWQNAITNRDTANAASDRNIASLKQKLADLTPADDNLDVRSAMLTVQQRQNALDDAQQALSNYTLTAPFDGTMASVSVDIGASAVMASSNSSSALGTIVTDKKLAQITVNETDITEIRLGQKVSMTFDAIDNLVASGEVVEVNTLGTVTSGVVTYKIKISFSTDDQRILPNMSVSADIVTDNKDNVLYVQNQAIKRDKDGYYVEKNSNLKNINTSFASSTVQGEGRKLRNGTTAKRLEASGQQASTNEEPVTIVRIPVTIGLQTDTQTEITSGLSVGETILLKKTTAKVSVNTSSAPSITSLLRPQGQNRQSGTAVAPRPN